MTSTEKTTTTIPATVYLNHADGALFGFRAAKAQLREAITFELPIPTGTRPATTAIAAALRTVFEQLNCEPTENWALKYRLAGHRSLSVGDVVKVGETAWAVASIGWSPVHADELRDARNR